MAAPNNQILTVAQMQAAEQALIAGGTSVDALMQIAGQGAAEWIWRIAAGRSVTVLCGPGNNGGDGYVIAETLRRRGLKVQVVAPKPPSTDAAKNARQAWQLPVASSGKGVDGAILVDCLFGSGLSRPLSPELALLLRDLAGRHAYRVAIDLPSGVSSDDGKALNDHLPEYDLSLSLGAWKYAHWTMPACARMGARRLVPIGVSSVPGAATLIDRPDLGPPASDAHKYRRGLCAVIGGEMPGAAVLACISAMRGGAGYTKLLSESTDTQLPPDLVRDASPLSEAVSDHRIDALLVGPGLGRSDDAANRLRTALQAGLRTVLDADALMLLKPDMLGKDGTYIATPHYGELDRLCHSFAVVASSKKDRAGALARASGMVVIAKGPDTLVAAPDGRIALARPASSWLSVAGSGDVLAGIAASRLAAGRNPFDAACDAVWLHGEAARLAGGPFTATELAGKVASAYAACL
ncbi:NAD(P)H-hydrate dehydratase [Pontixanthobacter luteolus]|uniref:NAD(P)H-hydrate dehydratase n=1 Tax=Pontixanthobacter luteolus TaxID=295089 RepID=UPI00230320B3|nr:NAD(P)H-hydrate dehydratase [Pontixanthobacter luteolus]